MKSAFEDQDNLLREILLKVPGLYGTRDESIVAFVAAPGRLYQHDLMVVGRAVNGWCSEPAKKVANPADMTSFVERVRASSSATTEPCALQTVMTEWNDRSKPYQYVRSAFWRTAKRVVEGLHIPGFQSREWANYLLWSNLYKVASTVGNPGIRLQNLQRESCIELIELELTYFKPKRVLFLTGEDWASKFVEPLELSTGKKSPLEHVQRTGLLKAGGADIPFVIAKHPQGKPEGVIVDAALRWFEQY